MTPTGWGPGGMRESRRVVSLTHAQCDALAELAADMLPHHRMAVQQTYTKSGGTHLYVLKGGVEHHISATGSVRELA